MQNIRHYSKRILNPFSGTAQIVEFENTRAICTDGLNWQLLVSNEIVQKPWSELRIYGHSDQYFKYGSWSKSVGLKRLPVHPTLYQKNIEQNIRSLIAKLRAAIPELPFKPKDRYELWLLDPNNKPVVILNSSIDHRALSLPTSTDWLPGLKNESHVQVEVTNILHNRLGHNPACAWFKRDEYNHGYMLSSRPTELIKKHPFISNEHFPELTLSCKWGSKTETDLVHKYIAMQSPILLTLDSLRDETRQKLEVYAEQYPTIVEKFYRLYPKVMDMVLLNKILVEARMRNALA